MLPSSARPFKVGDKAQFRLGVRTVTGTVVADDGNIGVGGQQVLRVEVPFESTDPLIWILQAEQITLVPPRRRKAAPVARRSAQGAERKAARVASR